MSSNTLRNALPKRKIPLPPLKIIYRDKVCSDVTRPATQSDSKLTTSFEVLGLTFADTLVISFPAGYSRRRQTRRA